MFIQGVVTTLAGHETTGDNSDGQGTAAAFNSLSLLGVSTSGDVYAADYLNYEVRKITSSGLVTVVAGNHAGGAACVDDLGPLAQFSGVIAVSVSCVGDLYVADQVCNNIRKIVSSGTIDLNGFYFCVPFVHCCLMIGGRNGDNFCWRPNRQLWLR